MTPGRRHRVLVIGAGSIGERHLRCFLATGRAEVSFVEIRPSLRSEVAARYPAAVGHESVEQALANGVDCAVTATPAPLHVPEATRLARNGIHVLIEKPLGVGTEGVDSLAAAADRSGAVLAVAYVYRAHPALAAMRREIASGRFGRPVQLVANCGQNFPFYRPAYRDTYYRDRATGGGAIQDALTHILNAAEWLVGPVTGLFADAGHLLVDGVEVEDTVHLVARHGDVMAAYTLNQHQAPNETSIAVACERGTVRFEMHERRWRWAVEPGQPWRDEPAVTLERDDLFIRQANSFLDAAEGLSPPLCDLAGGVQTLRVNLAALESADTRRWINLRDPEIGS